MVNASPVSEYKLDKILSSLEELKREVSRVKEKLEEAPPYGSEEWWEWSIHKAEKEFARGDYYELQNTKELDDFLENIKKGQSNGKYHHQALENS